MRLAARSIPNSSAVTAVRDGDYRPAIKAGAGDAGVNASWARLIGTVIDFRLRLAFTTANLVPPTAQRGHAALTRRHPDAAPLLTGLTDAIGVALGAAGPMDGSRIELLPGRAEDDLVRLCVVAGQLDQLYRNYESASRATPLLEQGRVVTVEQAAAQVPDRVVDDLHDQVRIANDGLGALRAAATTAAAGLEFAGSRLIGADADLLVDGLLLDFKAKNEPTTIKKPDVYQLAGYVLLDFDDTHRIDRVGIYWTRHGVMRTFTEKEKSDGEEDHARTRAGCRCCGSDPRIGRRRAGHTRPVLLRRLHSDPGRRDDAAARTDAVHHRQRPARRQVGAAHDHDPGRCHLELTGPAHGCASGRPVRAPIHGRACETQMLAGPSGRRNQPRRSSSSARWFDPRPPMRRVSAIPMSLRISSAVTLPTFGSDSST